MLKEILPRIPKHRIYTEAFFGGGAVFFAKEPSRAEIINDTNGMVVNFFEVARTDFAWLKSQIGATLFARESYSKAWLIYKIPSLADKRLRALAFYVACNMGFASKPESWGYDKYSKRGKTFRNRTMQFDESIAKRLEFVQIENNDACKVIASRDTSETFNFVDSPYINTDQGDYRGYTECDSRNLLDTLSNIKGTFFLSSYPSEILDEYVAKHGWDSIRFDKPLSANKAKDGKKRPHKVEVPTANYTLNKDETKNTNS